MLDTESRGALTSDIKQAQPGIQITEPAHGDATGLRSSHKGSKSDQVWISKVHEQPQAQLQSQTKDQRQEAEQKQNPWAKNGKAPLSLFSHSSSQQHSHTALELASSTRVWILRALWESVQLSMSVQTWMLPLYCGLSLWGRALIWRDTCSDWSVEVFCSPVYRCSDEFNTSPGISAVLHNILQVQGKYFFFLLLF